MNELNVDGAKARDIPGLVKLAEEFMPEEGTVKQRMKMLKQALANPNYENIVADLSGTTVGFIDIWYLPDLSHAAPLGYIQTLFVAETHRGKGIGSQLLEEAIDHAKKRGVKELHVSTSFDNKQAIRLYKKHGFIGENMQLEMEFKE